MFLFIVAVGLCSAAVGTSCCCGSFGDAMAGMVNDCLRANWKGESE